MKKVVSLISILFALHCAGAPLKNLTNNDLVVTENEFNVVVSNLTANITTNRNRIVNAETQAAAAHTQSSDARDLSTSNYVQVTNLATTVSNLSTTVNNKADAIVVASLSDTVKGKADTSTVDSVATSVSKLSTTVASLSNTVNTKADKSTVDSLTTNKADKTTTTSLSIRINANQTNIQNLNEHSLKNAQRMAFIIPVDPDYPYIELKGSVNNFYRREWAGGNTPYYTDRVEYILDLGTYYQNFLGWITDGEFYTDLATIYAVGASRSLVQIYPDTSSSVGDPLLEYIDGQNPGLYNPSYLFITITQEQCRRYPECFDDFTKRGLSDFSWVYACRNSDGIFKPVGADRYSYEDLLSGLHYTDYFIGFLEDSEGALIGYYYEIPYEGILAIHSDGNIYRATECVNRVFYLDGDEGVTSEEDVLGIVINEYFNQVPEDEIPRLLPPQWNPITPTWLYSLPQNVQERKKNNED